MKKWLALALLLPTVGFAQEDVNTMDGLIELPHGLYEEIGSAGDWTAIRFMVDEQATCAIFSRPTESRIFEGDTVIAALRGERAAFITWEAGPVNENAGVFSAIVGAPVEEAAVEHQFESENGTFPMYGGYGDRLFVFLDKDVEAIDTIRRGLTLTLTAVLPGDRRAVDEYSLRGVMASTDLAKEVCGATE